MYTLQSIQGNLSGFHFLVIWRKIDVRKLMSDVKRNQIPDFRSEVWQRLSAIHITQFLHYMSENLLRDVDYMERWLH